VPCSSADVVVAGAGPAGSACAATLARAGADVLLVEASGFDRPRIGETLSPRALSAVRRLGHEPAGHREATAIRSAWGSDDLYEHSYVFDLGQGGLHLDRTRFDAGLAAAATRAGARLRLHTRVRAADGGPGAWRVRLAPDEVVTCATVVDATGRTAALARRLDARVTHADRLVATAVRVEACLDADPLTLVEAAADGWWYTTPLPGDAMVAVYLHDAGTPAVAPGPGSHTAARVTGGRLHSSRRVSARTTLRHGCGPGWAATGEAAAAVDPLSGDGIFRALADGVRTAEWIGGGGHPNTLAAQRHAEHGALLAEREQAYGAEQRWTTPFWSSRHPAPASATLAE
jgi:flavin-dependent dehydrogenase